MRKPILAALPALLALSSGAAEPAAPSFSLKPEGFGYPRSIAISPRPNSSRNIAHSTLIEFDELDRSPQVEAPERFNRRRLEALGAPRGRSL